MTLGVAGRGEADTQPTGVHVAALRLEPAASYTISFTVDLHTWDSYNANDGMHHTGYWDSFSVSVTNQPYPTLNPVDPIALPGGGFQWGGTSFNDTVKETLTGTQTLTFSGNPNGENYLNVILDTQPTSSGTVGILSGRGSANHPSWGIFGFTILPQSRPHPPLTPVEFANCYNNGSWPLPVELLYSDGPVRYFDGTLQLASTDLESGGFGSSWGHTRSWTNHPGYDAASYNGSAWVVNEQPVLLPVYGDQIIALVSSGTDAIYFDLLNQANGTYQARLSPPETLRRESNDEYTLTDSDGNQYRFYGISSSVPANQRGHLQSFTDPAGNVTSVLTRTTDGKVAEMQRSQTLGTGTTLFESYLFSYSAAGLLESVTLRRKSDTGDWLSMHTVRQATYVYYLDGELFGNAGDLKLVYIRDKNGIILETKYYRYYKPGETGGYAGGLKYVFEPHSFERLAAAFPDPFSVSDENVAPFADFHFEFDAQQRVSKEKVQGRGDSTSTTSTGLGQFTFSYSSSSYQDGYNSLKYRTEETLPDLTKNIVYANFRGEVMLKVFVSGNQQWRDYYQYNDLGELVLHASPSAVSGHSDTQANLAVDLADDAGLIETMTYYTSTTATETIPGDAAGYLKETRLQRGELGPSALQETFQYVRRTAGNATVFPVGSVTVYPNEANTSNPQETRYAYTWFSGTTRIESMSVTRPTISSSQNGPGSADVESIFFDTYGREIWRKDGDGFLHYIAYDPATSAPIKRITDVSTDASHSSEYSTPPAGWAMPAGGGLHLVTEMEVDHLGRTTRLKQPGGNVTYTVYNDPNDEMRTYVGWDATTHQATGPTQVVREDHSGTYRETLTMTATPAFDPTSGRPTGAEPISSLQTLARTHRNSAGQVVRSDAYFNLAGIAYSTAPYLGTVNVNFYSTFADYDLRGRPNRSVSATGTITRQVYDGLSRVVTIWVGTNDQAPGDWSPSNNTAPANMVKVGENVYDNGGVGDGNRTQMTTYPGGGAAPRVTQYFFDWRNRELASKRGVLLDQNGNVMLEAANDPVNRPLEFRDYNNLNELTGIALYDGTGFAVTMSNGVPTKPADYPAGNRLRAYQEIKHDDQGRVFRTEVSNVNPTTGQKTTTLKTDVWYSRRGQVIKTSEPGGLSYKTRYDGAGRPVTAYVTDPGSIPETSWTAAGNILGDNVLSQTETQYDANGNPILTITKERFHDETATGELGNATTAPKARVSYVAQYYDLADRLTASVDVGTNGGVPYTRPATVPARSDTVLISSNAYSPAGWVATVTDPREIQFQTFYDNLGRPTKTVEAFAGSGFPTANNNRTTELTYDGSNHVVTSKAYISSSAFETTQYVYGVSTTSGSDLKSNDILAAIHYPDKVTGNPSAAEKESYQVNALAERKTLIDRNVNQHNYSFDVVGRPTADTVTVLGQDVNGSVRRLETAYDSAGRPYQFTSYSAQSGGDVVNQVRRLYNGFGQLTTEYQATAGAVTENLALTPAVRYVYTEAGQSANHSRLTKMIYPGNGRELNYSYNTGIDERISRVSSLTNGVESLPLEVYSYLGLDTMVKRSRPQLGIELTYVKRTGEANGEAGDPYTGLDRFGRVVDQRWIVSSSGSATDRFAYGYDRDSNRLYRDNKVNPAFGELYHAGGASNGYNNFNELLAFRRGTLSDSNTDGVPDTVNSPSRSQSWDFDGFGNWGRSITDGAQTFYNPNAQNQFITAGQATLTYDPNGNTTRDVLGTLYTFDAWNRLVTATTSAGSVSYTFDALGRRVSETSGASSRQLYYNAAWQVIEEGQPFYPQAQYVWSPVAADTLVLRERDPYGSRTPKERLWVQQDANGNVTALVNIVNSQPTVVERYITDPYGQPTVLAPDWTTRVSSLFAWSYLHQGGRYDNLSGLYHFRHRDFSPTLGRWMQVDPIAGDGSNLYWYERNNPTNALDPMGLKCHGPTEEEQAAQREMALNALQIAIFVAAVLDPEPVSKAFLFALDAYISILRGAVAWERGNHLEAGVYFASAAAPVLTELAAAGLAGPLANSLRGLGRAEEVVGLAAPQAGLRLATGMGESALGMSVVRTIERGERVADIINEVKQLTFTTGNEYAVVKLADGSRALVSGGPGGINFVEGQITRLFGHSHPYQLPATGPSHFDFIALQSLGQRSSYLLERGQLTKFSRGN